MERPDAETNHETPTLQDWLIALAGLAVIVGVLALLVLWLLSFDWWWLFIIGFGFMVFIDICCILVIFDYLRKASIVRNIATSRIRSAAQGYVEIIAPARPCLSASVFGPLNEQKSDWYNHRESGPLVLEQDGVSCFVRTDKAADPDYVDLDTVSETPVKVPFVGENCYAIGFFRTVNSASDIYENDIRKEIENNFEYDANRPISEQIPEEIEPNSILGSLLAHREQWWSYCRANEGIGSGDPSGFVQLHTLGPYSGTNLPMVLSREPQRVLVKSLRTITMMGIVMAAVLISFTWFLGTLVWE